MPTDAKSGDWLSHLLIVPGAHVRLGDFDFQAATYEEFHLHWGTRVVHMLCTPLVLVGTLVSLNAIPVEIFELHVPAGGVVLAAGLIAYFVGLDALIGVVSIPWWPRCSRRRSH